ncbi:hypothetical protein K8R32_00905, partial [bacterium]|nr:hypothetical protein [bacterium]
MFQAENNVKEIENLIKSVIERGEYFGSNKKEASKLSRQHLVINRIFKQRWPLVEKKYKALDYILLGLIYYKEAMIMNGGNRNIVFKYEKLINKYINFSELIVG